MKIKGAIIIHVKFRGARKLMILRCFIILYVQILSGFENWDIQDLTLRRYDTIKVVDEISLTFPELFIIKKYVIIRFNTGDQPCNFLEVKRSTILQKLNKRDCFCNILGLIFMALLAQKLIYTVNIYLTLCLAHFLNKIIY